jgi:DNA-binding MarR family transcriptional regulator
LKASAKRLPDRRELCRLACRIYDARRTRDKLMDHKLFSEPAWDMLLALYCLPARGERLTVTALSLAANTQVTTGLRWQKALTEHGLIERGPGGVDQRKQMVRLTAEGREMMNTYLTRLFYCDTPMPPHPELAGG